MQLRQFQWVILTVTTLTLVACKVGPNFERPPTPPTNHYLYSKPKIAKQFYTTANIPSDWWQIYHSKVIERLVQRGLQQSPTLEAAKQALVVAEEQLKQTTISQLWPNLALQLGASRQRIVSAQFGGTGASTFSLYNAVATLSYNPDIFGQYRRMVEASAAQVDFQLYELGAAQLTLTGNIVTTAIAIASLEAQIQAVKELIGVERNILKVMTAQLSVGGIAEEQWYAQKTLVAQTEALLPPLQNTLAQEQHAMAAFIGSTTSDFAPQHLTLKSLHLAKRLPLTLPSTMVRQRPDILAAEALMHQASANIGVATAQMLPQITISGQEGWTAETLGALFSPATNVWAFGGTLLQSVLQEGALAAARRAAIAQFKENAAQYQQTVLNAFASVANALRAIEFDADLNARNREAEHAANKTFQIVTHRFDYGGENYINVLNAEHQYLNTKLNEIQSYASQLNDSAALFVALGGGWWGCNEGLTK